MPTLRELIDADIKNIFMNTGDFAFQFLNARTGLNIGALFDNQFAVIIDDVESTAPAITVAAVDVPGVNHNDLFTDTETAIVYKVAGIQPDGTGLTLLVLTRN